MSAVLQSQSKKAYPAAMDQKLRQICRRLFALAVVRAFLLGMAALLAAMLVAMTIDWCFTLFSTTVRVVLTVSALSVAVATLLAAAIGPVRASLGLMRAAGDVDQATPQLEERWTTVANFVESNHRPRSAIGKAMLRQVTSEAVAMERLVKPATIATPQQLRSAVVLFLAATMLVAAFLSINWQLHCVLLSRFWSPLANITATQLESVSGDLVVPRGEPVELVIRMAGFSRDTATIVLASDDAEDTTAELTPNDEQPAQFKYNVAALESSFRYRVTAGDGRTEWHSVTAIDRPALAEVKVTLTAPEYVDRPVFEKDYLPAHIQAVQGSHLRLAMRPAAGLKSFELQITQGSNRIGTQVSGMALATGEPATKEQKLLLNADHQGWYRFEATLEDDVTITPSLLSPHDLKNEDAQKCNIRVIPDRAPIARVISPTEEMAVKPNEVIEVKFEAHDDHGIAKAELVVYEESSVEGEPSTIRSVEEIPLDDQENAPHVVAAAKLDLSKYELREGASISYAIRVTDNRIAMREQSRGEPSGQSGTLRASETAAEVNNNDQVAKANATVAKDSPAEDRPADKMRNEAPMTEGKSSDGEFSKSNSDQGSPSERPGTDSLSKADSRRIEGDQPANPRGNAEQVAGTEANPSNNNSKRESKAKQTDSEQPGTERVATSEVKPVSKASSDSDPITNNPAGKGETAQDTQPATALDKPAPPVETSSNSKSTVANAASEQNATAREVEKGAESKSTSESAANTDVGSKRSNAKQQESQPSTSSAAISAVARRDDEMPANKQSMVKGDLTSVNRRPTMTDDLRGQFTESNRLRLKIEEKLISAAEPGKDRETLQLKIRQKLEQIDGELKPVEEVLSSIVATVSQSGLADPQIQELTSVDQRLAKVDQIIANLRKESTETPLAFAGLHMVEIGTAYITPARDRVFALIRQPDVDTRSNVAEALHRISRARELLAELLVRYDRARREDRLADAIEETAKFYEVYVENLHRFLRAQSKPNPNPLQRKMAIVDVDQDYFDRLREVTEMRREMMAEFARMLADDPRLLSKYMDLIKRRQTSLRDRLTKLHERQEGIATELSGWLRVDEAQREDVWMLAAEVRLQDIAPLAQEVSQLEERTTSQFPLALDPKAKESSAVIQDVKQLAVSARTAAVKSRQLLRDPSNERVDLAADVDGLAFWLAELDAALEQLAFDNENEETTDFTNKRLAESRTLFERVIGWTEMVSHLQARRFGGLAKVDQQQLAFRTELLRSEIEGIDEQLATEFRGEVPESVSALANELKQLMETITFNQAAATFELESERLSAAESQQGLALEAFKRAGDLFDRIRRKVIEELDKIDPPDPNIAELEDPTLDELLEQLEREPNLNALLGLPNRPQNLRVISDFVASMDGDVPVPLALEQAAEQARRRAKDEQKEARRMRQETDKDDDKTEEEWKQVADAEDAQQKLQEKIDELKRRAADPETEPEEAEKLRQMADQLAQMRQQLAGRQIDKQQWEEMIQTDQMRAILRAAARGDPLPSSQWNRLMSSLDDGLWQVQRRTPPEEFRQAIEQYQERIRKLMNVETDNASP